MRYFIHLAYKGTFYRGWQRQINTEYSIQQILENAITKMTGTTTTIMGCGRTDAGVHAMQYFAHFDYEGVWAYDPVERLNRVLPDDISVFEIIEMPERAHSRYDAIKRSYEYHVHFEKNPYLETFSYYARDIKPDVEMMQKGLQYLKETEDFRYMCLTPDRVNNTLCTIYEASAEMIEDNKRLILKFTANRFLKSMIRIITGRLLALSTGKMSWYTFVNVSSGKEKLKFNLMAHPNGLHLTKVVYPYLDKEVRVRF
ncbi:MAG: tRNA pseudouridine synthase A [Saprospiraceae bacterium]|nr:tRNA pseudouridine synthase A [Saprospiraceae bacterium]